MTFQFLEQAVQPHGVDLLYSASSCTYTLIEDRIKGYAVGDGDLSEEIMKHSVNYSLFLEHDWLCRIFRLQLPKSQVAIRLHDHSSSLGYDGSNSE